MTRLSEPVPAPARSTDKAFAAFKGALQRSGARAALADLVGLTSDRFIGIFHFSEGMARAVIFCDRENPEVVRTCRGVPVLNAEGRLLGTLCHDDVVPGNADQLDMPLLLQVASTLALGHHVPPYPLAA